MKTSTTPLLGLEEVELPSSTRTRGGVQFNPSQDVWKYRDGLVSISLDFSDISAPLGLRHSLKRVLAWYAEHYSPDHLRNLFERFRQFSAAAGLRDDTITALDLINYRSTLNRKTEHYLGMLSGHLKRWHRMRVPGISDDAAKYLRSVRLRGNLKGVAVLTMDPETGSFTDIEYEAIRAALVTAYQTGLIRLDEYVLVLLFMALGARPIQYAAMKLCDLAIGSDQNGHEVYMLSVPRAKRRGNTLRSTFAKRVLVPELGSLVKQHSDQVCDQFAELLNDTAKAPLFPCKEPPTTESQGFEFHHTSQSLAHQLALTISKLYVHSERTGQKINIIPTRFRRTFGSRAAAEGHGELVIAELLDHTDTQHVGVYVEATPGMMERIDRAVALKMAPLAQAFAGTIITDESQATRATDPASRIRDPRFDSTKPVGNCGQFGFCGLLAPVACYTCRSFEPWLDGPHERVLEFLIAERARLLVQADKRVASINDRTILAVADVVRRCGVMKGKPMGDPNG